MKVVFIKDVKGAGLAGQIKEVSDGYAGNFLLPNKLARQALSSDLNRKENKSFSQKKIDKKREEMKKQIKRLDGLQLEIRAKADEQNHLFGSFSANTLMKELKNKEIEINQDMLKFEPIKQLGFHEIKLDFGGLGSAKVRLTIIREK